MTHRPSHPADDARHVVQLANFVSPTSGGIRRVIDRLREGYAAAGHRTTLIVPGPHDITELTRYGLLVQVRAPVVPGTGGYRMIIDLGAIRDRLEDLAPDRIEVHDRFTLRRVASWAAERGVPAIAVVHERLDRLAAMHVPWFVPTADMVRRDNAALAATFDAIVCPSPWAAQEFVDAGVDNVHAIGWGVDLSVFSPSRRSKVLRRRLLAGAEVLVVMVCRLSPEKRPETALAALRSLLDRGVGARLVIAGTGRSERRMRRAASGLPVTFLGHLDGRHHIAELLAAGDVALCPGPVETFGLAGLEALASGTPVVSSRSGAVAGLLAEPYGIAAYNHGPSMASAVQRLAAGGPAARAAARTAAERHPWPDAVAGMLRLQGLWSTGVHVS